MKKFLLGLFLFFSLCIPASDSIPSIVEIGGSVVVGACVLYLYPAFVEKTPEDTLFIGEESCKIKEVSVRMYTDRSPELYSSYAEKSRTGVALGKYFIGYKTENGKEYSGIMQDGNKPISRNDWYRLATGTAAGLATYALIKYCDKK